VLFHLVENYILSNEEAAAQRLVQRYHELDPRDPAASGAEITLLLARGKASDAVAVVERAGLESSSVSAFAAYAYLLAGDAERAERVCETLLARTPASSTNTEALLNRAMARVARGRLEAVRTEIDGGLGPTAGSAFAMTAWTVGVPELAVDDLAATLRHDRYSCLVSFWLGFLLCESGRTDEAERVLATFDQYAADMISPLVPFWRALLAGALGQARGDLSEARRQLDRADSQPIECRDRGLSAMLRARLETAAGNREPAIAAWRELIDPPYLRYSSFGQRNLPWRPIEIVAHYELARLEEQRGEVAAAREHYRRFLDYWGTADVPLPSIANARERVAKLEGR
jgi:tetratricopeptide (TPR) repeat protein